MDTSNEIPCQNMVEGCKPIVAISELNTHTHQKVCPIVGCDWVVLKEILTHIKEKHENCHAEGKWVTEWNMKEGIHELVVINLKEEVFFVHQKLKNEMMYWIAQYLGKPEDVQHYRYNIWIDMHNKGDLSITHECSAGLQTLEEVIKEGACIHLPLSLLKQYLDANTGKLSFSVSIIDRRITSKTLETSACFSDNKEENSTIESVSCQFKNCVWNGLKSYIAEHVRKEHNSYYVNGDWYLTDKGSVKMVFMEFDSEYFYAYQTVRGEDIYWFVQFIGQCKLTEDYEYYFKVCYKYESCERYSSTRHVSYFQRIEETVSKGRYVDMPVKEFLRSSNKCLRIVKC